MTSCLQNGIMQHTNTLSKMWTYGLAHLVADQTPSSKIMKYLVVSERAFLRHLYPLFLPSFRLIDLVSRRGEAVRQIDQRVCAAAKGVFFKIAEMHCKGGFFDKCTVTWVEISVNRGKNQEFLLKKSDCFTLKGLKIWGKWISPIFCCTVRVWF